MKKVAHLPKPGDKILAEYRRVNVIAPVAADLQYLKAAGDGYLTLFAVQCVQELNQFLNFRRAVSKLVEKGFIAQYFTHNALYRRPGSTHRRNNRPVLT